MLAIAATAFGACQPARRADLCGAVLRRASDVVRGYWVEGCGLRRSLSAACLRWARRAVIVVNAAPEWAESFASSDQPFDPATGNVGLITDPIQAVGRLRAPRTQEVAGARSVLQLLVRDMQLSDAMAVRGRRLTDCADRSVRMFRNLPVAILTQPNQLRAKSEQPMRAESAQRSSPRSLDSSISAAAQFAGKSNPTSTTEATQRARQIRQELLP